MKISILISTIFMAAAALAAPATTSESTTVEVRQDNGVPNGPCEKCDQYYKDCLHLSSILWLEERLGWGHDYD
ncbi:hypothetical protein N0V83_001647 [Neocucurbitaria cava]|uniref:Uncharacterized protein n=1 Tax=Neocucurbitaria cava TaxID=798079 RepID=A0A9W8YHK0_9PLEO|nr:hypothetical protein N0V83_001647 [Neocucurbitaria cava]